MTLRIAIALHDFSLGGTERIAIRLANQWAADGAEVVVLAGSERGELRGLLDETVTLWVASPAIARRPGSVARLGRAVRRRLTQAPADVLFVPGNYHWPVAAAFRSVLRERRPLIVAQVSNALRKPGRGKLGQFLFEVRTRWRLRDANAIVTLSEPDKRLADQLLRRGDVVAIPLPALSASPIPPVPVDPACRLILAAGRFVPQKGFDVLIEAFAIVARQDERNRLLLVGDGPQRARLERQIRTLALTKRVDLPGYVDDLRPCLDRARMFVLPSRFEGYPAVIIEAVAAGRPVISTACTTAAEELLTMGGAGRVVPIEDAEAMAAAILAQLAAPIPDPGALADWVEPFRIDTVARRYEALFRDLVSRERSRIGTGDEHRFDGANGPDVRPDAV